MHALFHLRRFSVRRPASLLALMLVFVLAQSLALVCCIPCAGSAGKAERSAGLSAAAPDKASDIGDTGRCTDCASCSVLVHAAPPVAALFTVAATHGAAIIPSTVRSPLVVATAVHFSSRAPPRFVV